MHRFLFFHAIFASVKTKGCLHMPVSMRLRSYPYDLTQLMLPEALLSTILPFLTNERWQDAGFALCFAFTS